MECYEIENKEDALLLACHLLRDYHVEGYVDEDGTMILEYKAGYGQWFFVYKNLDIEPKRLEVATGYGDYYLGGPPENRIQESSLFRGHGYWAYEQGTLFPVELKDMLYPILSDSPSDNNFEIPGEWEQKRHALLFGGGSYYPFAMSDWMCNRRAKIRSWLSDSQYMELAFLWAAETGQSHSIDILRMFDNELLDKVLNKAACTPRVNKAKFKYLLRTAISEDAATYRADLVTSQVARVIGY